MARSLPLALSFLLFSCFGNNDEDTGPDWSTCSNTKARIDMPFEYTINGTHLVAPNEAGDAETYIHLGSFGAHFPPLTDHNYGDPKANLVGFFSASDADLEEIDTNVMAYFGGLDGSVLHANRPLYTAPLAGKITNMSYVESTSNYFLDDESTWQFLITMGDIAIRFFHVGKIHPDLKNDIFDKTGIDVDTYSEPGENLLKNTSISVNAGDPLGFPQIVAQEVIGFEGYYRGDGSFYGDRPSIIMEFSIVAPVASGFDEVCYFKLLGSEKEEEMETAFSLDLLDENSQRFGPWQNTDWQWKAEGELCLFCKEDTAGFYGLYERLGAWWETDDYGSDENETLSFAWINQSANSYLAANYAGNQMGYEVECLISRRRNDGASYLWNIPGEGLLSTDEPVGEILISSSSELLIMWRNLGNGSQVGYQKLAFIPGNNVIFASGYLFAVWGEFAASPAEAETPSFGNLEDTNGNTRVWYNLNWRPGF